WGGGARVGTRLRRARGEKFYLSLATRLATQSAKNLATRTVSRVRTRFGWAANFRSRKQYRPLSRSKAFFNGLLGGQITKLQLRLLYVQMPPPGGWATQSKWFGLTIAVSVDPGGTV